MQSSCFFGWIMLGHAGFCSHGSRADLRVVSLRCRLHFFVFSVHLRSVVLNAALQPSMLVLSNLLLSCVLLLRHLGLLNDAMRYSMVHVTQLPWCAIGRRALLLRWAGQL